MFQAKRVCCFVHFLLLFISRIQNENATRDTNNKWASFSYILPIGNANVRTHSNSLYCVKCNFMILLQMFMKIRLSFFVWRIYYYIAFHYKNVFCFTTAAQILLPSIPEMDPCPTFLREKFTGEPKDSRPIGYWSKKEVGSISWKQFAIPVLIIICDILCFFKKNCAFNI